MILGQPSGDLAAQFEDLHVSARLEDLKFMLTLGAVVLLGSGLDVILR